MLSNYFRTDCPLTFHNITEIHPFWDRDLLWLWTSKRWQHPTLCCWLYPSRQSSPQRSHHCVTWKPVCSVGVGGVMKERYSLLHLSSLGEFRKQLHGSFWMDLKRVFVFFLSFSPEIFSPVWYLSMKTTWVHLWISWFALWRRKSFNCQGSPGTSLSIACTCLYKHRKVGLRQHHWQSFFRACVSARHLTLHWECDTILT